MPQLTWLFVVLHFHPSSGTSPKTYRFHRSKRTIEEMFVRLTLSLPKIATLSLLEFHGVRTHTTEVRTSKCARSARRYQRANAAIMHAHVRYSRVLHYRQGPKLRGRTYTFVHVTYLDVLYLVPCTHTLLRSRRDARSLNTRTNP